MDPFYLYLIGVGLFFSFAFLLKWLFLKSKNYTSIEIAITEKGDGKFNLDYTNQHNIETPYTPVFYGNKENGITMFIHIIFS